MSGGRGSAQKVIIAERRQLALALRRENMSYRAIADTLRPEYPGYVHTTAFKDVQAELVIIRTKTGEIADDVRQMELERLDVIQRALWPFVQQGSPLHVNAALRISERRAKLLGLDAPEKIDSTVRSDLADQLENVLKRVYSKTNDAAD